jgi:hypothetical protein
MAQTCSGPRREVLEAGLPVAGVGTVGGAVGDKGVAAADAAAVGWLYTETPGDVKANTGTAADEAGTAYNTY